MCGRMKGIELKLQSRVLLVWLLMAICAVSHAQESRSAGPALEAVVRKSRTESINPRATPPKWMDYEKVRAGFALLEKHGPFIRQILATSSLSSTFAARDITPILMQTGRLPRDFTKRMKETGDIIDQILQPSTSRDEFVSKNLASAYQLGMLHKTVASRVAPTLNWDPKERVPLSQQAYGLVLFSFAWWPIEALAATKQIDLAGAGRDLDGWFHLWSVIGYEMGVSERLLPRSYEKARELVPLLRGAQYTGGGSEVPDGVSVLLGAQVRWLVEATPTPPDGPKKTPEKQLAETAAGLAQVIQLSPGLVEALGLGKDPTGELIEFARKSR
jgi:hypothetical protein